MLLQASALSACRMLKRQTSVRLKNCRSDFSEDGGLLLASRKAFLI